MRALMERVLTVVCVWVFVCVGVRLLGEWCHVFSCVVLFSVCTCFSCVRVCQCRCVHQHPRSHSSSISTNTHTRSPHQYHFSMSWRVMSYHVTSHALQGQHTPTHSTPPHLTGRSVCEGFLSCVWPMFGGESCVYVFVCMFVWW